MRKWFFRHFTKRGKGGNKPKWKIVKNPWWVEQPYRLEPCGSD
jgi:hypothetical protein